MTKRKFVSLKSVRFIVLLLIAAIVFSCIFSGLNTQSIISLSSEKSDITYGSNKLDYEFAADQSYDGNISYETSYGNVLSEETFNGRNVTGGATVSGELQSGTEITASDLSRLSNTIFDNDADNNTTYGDYNSSYFYLTNDITISPKHGHFLYLSGKDSSNQVTFDGRGHTITVNYTGSATEFGVSASAYGNAFGLIFAKISYATVKNLNIVINGNGSTIKYNQDDKSDVENYFGAVFGYANNVAFQNITATVKNLNLLSELDNADFTATHTTAMGGFIARITGSSQLNNVIFNAEELSITLTSTSEQPVNDDLMNIYLGTFIAQAQGALTDITVNATSSSLTNTFTTKSAGSFYMGTVGALSGNSSNIVFNLNGCGYMASPRTTNPGDTTNTYNSFGFARLDSAVDKVYVIATSSILNFAYQIYDEDSKENKFYAGGFAGYVNGNIANSVLSLNGSAVSTTSSSVYADQYTGGFAGDIDESNSNITFSNNAVIFSNAISSSVVQNYSTNKNNSTNGENIWVETYNKNYAGAIIGYVSMTEILDITEKLSNILVLAPVTGLLDTHDLNYCKKVFIAGGGFAEVIAGGSDLILSIKNPENLYRDDSGNYGVYTAEYVWLSLEETYNLNKQKSITTTANLYSQNSSLFSARFDGNNLSALDFTLGSSIPSNSFSGGRKMILIEFFKDEIYSAADFNRVAYDYSMGAGYIEGIEINLMADITFESRLLPLGSASVSFGSVFNGNNHTITLNQGSVIYEQYYAGVFGAITNKATVTNLKIVNNAYIVAQGADGVFKEVFAGAFAGAVGLEEHTTDSATIQNIKVISSSNSYIASSNPFVSSQHSVDKVGEASVIAYAANVRSGAGGFAGKSYRTNISDCSSENAGTIYGYSAYSMLMYLGGFIGKIEGGTYNRISVAVNKFVKKFDGAAYVESDIESPTLYGDGKFDMNTIELRNSDLGVYIGGFSGRVNGSKNDGTSFQDISVIFTSLNAFNSIDTVAEYLSGLDYSSENKRSKEWAYLNSVSEYISLFTLATAHRNALFPINVVTKNCAVIYEDFIAKDQVNNVPYTKSYFIGVDTTTGESGKYGVEYTKNLVGGIYDFNGIAGPAGENKTITNGTITTTVKSYVSYYNAVEILVGEEGSSYGQGAGFMDKFTATISAGTVKINYFNEIKYGNYYGATGNPQISGSITNTSNEITISLSASHTGSVVGVFFVYSTDINNLSDFNRLAQAGVTFKNTVINLRTDLTFLNSDTVSLFNNFEGTFNGNNYTITVNKTLGSIFSSVAASGSVINLYLVFNSYGTGYNRMYSPLVRTLYGKVDNVNIDFLTVSSFNISSNSTFGAIATEVLSGGRINNCSVSFSGGTISATDNTSIFGGIAGEVESGGTVNGCIVYVNNNIKNSAFTGTHGLVAGQAVNGSVITNNAVVLSSGLNSANLPNAVIGTGGVQFLNNLVIVSGNYDTSSLKIAAGAANANSTYKATLIKVYGQGADSENFGALSVTKDSLGQLTVTAKQTILNSSGEEIPFIGFLDYDDGTTYSTSTDLSSYYSSNGSYTYDGKNIAVYYIQNQIDSESDLRAYFNQTVGSYKGIQFYLVSNIDFNIGTASDINTGNTFSGFYCSNDINSILNGNGYNINFYLSSGRNYFVSLFYNISRYGGIKNVNITYLNNSANSSVHSNFYGIAYYNNGIIEDVNIRYSSYIEIGSVDGWFGGIVLRNNENGLISDCSVEIGTFSSQSTGSVKTDSFGGIAWWNFGTIESSADLGYTTFFRLGAGAKLLPVSNNAVFGGLAYYNNGNIYSAATYIYGIVGSESISANQSRVAFSGGIAYNQAGIIAGIKADYNSDFNPINVYKFGGLVVFNQASVGSSSLSNLVNTVNIIGSSVYDDKVSFISTFGGVVAENYTNSSVYFTTVNVSRNIYTGSVAGGALGVQMLNGNLSNTTVNISQGYGIYSEGNDYSDSVNFGAFSILGGAVGGLLGAGYANISQSSVYILGKIKNLNMSSGFAAGAIGYRIGGTVNGLLTYLADNNIAAKYFAGVSYDTTVYSDVNSWLVKRNNLIINPSNFDNSGINVFSVAGNGTINAEFTGNIISVSVVVASSEITFPYNNSVKVYNRNTGYAFDVDTSKALTYVYNLPATGTSLDYYLSQIVTEVNSYSDLVNIANIFNTSNTAYLFGIWININSDLDILSDAEFVPLGNPNFSVTDVYGNIYTGFNGFINGNNHKVTISSNVNLYADYAGLIGYMGSNGRISNIAVVLDGVITGTSYAGALAAYCEGTVSNSAVLIRNNVKYGSSSDGSKGQVNVSSAKSVPGGIFGYINSALSNVWLIAKNNAYSDALENNFGLNRLNIIGYTSYNSVNGANVVDISMDAGIITVNGLGGSGFYEDEVSGSGQNINSFEFSQSMSNKDYFAVYLDFDVNSATDFSNVAGYSHDFDLKGITINITNNFVMDISGYQPLGVPEGNVYTFNGTINGNYNTITLGSTFNFKSGLMYSGLVGSLGAAGQIFNLTIKTNGNITVGKDSLFFGFIAGYSEGSIYNILVDLDYDIILENGISDMASIGGIAGYQKFAEKVNNVWFKNYQNFNAFSANSGSALNEKSTTFLARNDLPGIGIKFRLSLDSQNLTVDFIKTNGEINYNNDIKNKVTIILGDGDVFQTNSDSSVLRKTYSVGNYGISYIVYNKFVISNFTDLNNLSTNIANKIFTSYNVPGLVYIQSADIEINSFFDPIGIDGFKAIYDGNGYTITVNAGLTSKENTGIFGIIEGEVRNLIVKMNQSVLGDSTSDYTGALAGVIKGKVKNTVVYYNESQLNSNTASGRFAAAVGDNAEIQNSYLVVKNGTDKSAIPVKLSGVNDGDLLNGVNILSTAAIDIYDIIFSYSDNKLKVTSNSNIYISFEENGIFDQIFIQNSPQELSANNTQMFATSFKIRIESEKDFEDLIDSLNQITDYDAEDYIGITAFLTNDILLSGSLAKGFNKFDIALDGQGYTLRLKNLETGYLIDVMGTNAAIRNIRIVADGILGLGTVRQASLIRNLGGKIENVVFEIGDGFGFNLNETANSESEALRKEFLMIGSSNYSITNSWIVCFAKNYFDFTRPTGINTFVAAASDDIFRYEFSTSGIVFETDVKTGYYINWFRNYETQTSLSGVTSSNNIQSYSSTVNDKNLDISLIALNLAISVPDDMMELSYAVSAGLDLRGLTFDVLSSIDLSSVSYLSAGTQSKGFRGTFKGNGNTITLKPDSALFNRIDESGKVLNLNLITTGSENLIKNDSALIAIYNYGSISDVNVNIEGNINSSSKFAAAVLYNYGTLNNIVVTVAQSSSLNIYEFTGLIYNNQGRVTNASFVLYGNIASNAMYSKVGLGILFNTGAVSNLKIDINNSVTLSHNGSGAAGAIYSDSAYTLTVEGIIVNFNEGGSIKASNGIYATVAGAIAYNSGTSSSVAVVNVSQDNLSAPSGTVIYVLDGTGSSSAWAVIDEFSSVAINQSAVSVIKIIGDGSVTAEFISNNIVFTSNMQYFSGYYKNLGEINPEQISSQSDLNASVFSTAQYIYAVFIKTDIADFNDFIYFIDSVNSNKFSGITNSDGSLKTFKLSNNITITSSQAALIQPIVTTSDFSFVFDGNNKTVSVISGVFAKEYANMGLFGYIAKNVTVKNLVVELSSNISGSDITGVLAAINEGMVESVTVRISGGTVSGTNFAGGLVGRNNGKIISCSIQITNGSSIVSSGGSAGGLVGLNVSDTGIYSSNVSVINSTLTANNAVGGFAGKTESGVIENSNLTMRNSAVYGTGQTANLGGFVGANLSYSENNVSSAIINLTDVSFYLNNILAGEFAYAGGFAGRTNSSVSNVYVYFNGGDFLRQGISLSEIENFGYIDHFSIMAGRVVPSYKESQLQKALSSFAVSFNMSDYANIDNTTGFNIVSVEGLENVSEHFIITNSDADNYIITFANITKDNILTLYKNGEYDNTVTANSSSVSIAKSSENQKYILRYGKDIKYDGDLLALKYVAGSSGNIVTINIVEDLIVDISKINSSNVSVNSFVKLNGNDKVINVTGNIQEIKSLFNVLGDITDIIVNDQTSAGMKINSSSTSGSVLNILVYSNNITENMFTGSNVNNCKLLLANEKSNTLSSGFDGERTKAIKIYNSEFADLAFEKTESGYNILNNNNNKYFIDSVSLDNIFHGFIILIDKNINNSNAETVFNLLALVTNASNFNADILSDKNFSIADNSVIELNNPSSIKEFSGSITGKGKITISLSSNSSYFIETLSGSLSGIELNLNSSAGYSYQEGFIKNNSGNINSLKISFLGEYGKTAYTSSASYPVFVNTNTGTISSLLIIDGKTAAASQHDNYLVAATNNGVVEKSYLLTDYSGRNIINLKNIYVLNQADGYYEVTVSDGIFTVKSANGNDAYIYAEYKDSDGKLVYNIINSNVTLNNLNGSMSFYDNVNVKIFIYTSLSNETDYINFVEFMKSISSVDASSVTVRIENNITLSGSGISDLTQSYTLTNFNGIIEGGRNTITVNLSYENDSTFVLNSNNANIYDLLYDFGNKQIKFGISNKNYNVWAISYYSSEPVIGTEKINVIYYQSQNMLNSSSASGEFVFSISENAQNTLYKFVDYSGKDSDGNTVGTTYYTETYKTLKESDVYRTSTFKFVVTLNTGTNGYELKSAEDVKVLRDSNLTAGTAKLMSDLICYEAIMLNVPSGMVFDLNGKRLIVSNTFFDTVSGTVKNGTVKLDKTMINNAIGTLSSTGKIENVLFDVILCPEGDYIIGEMLTGATVTNSYLAATGVSDSSDILTKYTFAGKSYAELSGIKGLYIKIANIKNADEFNLFYNDSTNNLRLELQNGYVADMGSISESNLSTDFIKYFNLSAKTSSITLTRKLAITVQFVTDSGNVLDDEKNYSLDNNGSVTFIYSNEDKENDSSTSSNINSYIGALNSYIFIGYRISGSDNYLSPYKYSYKFNYLQEDTVIEAIYQYIGAPDYSYTYNGNNSTIRANILNVSDQGKFGNIESSSSQSIKNTAYLFDVKIENGKPVLIMGGFKDEKGEYQQSVFNTLINSIPVNEKLNFEFSGSYTDENEVNKTDLFDTAFIKNVYANGYSVTLTVTNNYNEVLLRKNFVVTVSSALLEVIVSLKDSAKDSAKDKIYDGTADVVVQSDSDYIFETSNTNGLKGEDINNYKLSLVSEGSLTAALSYAENSAILNYSSKYSNKKNAESASAGGINITFTSDKGGLELIDGLKNNYFVTFSVKSGLTGNIYAKSVSVSNESIVYVYGNTSSISDLENGFFSNLTSKLVPGDTISGTFNLINANGEIFLQSQFNSLPAGTYTVNTSDFKVLNSLGADITSSYIISSASYTINVNKKTIQLNKIENYETLEYIYGELVAGEEGWKEAALKKLETYIASHLVNGDTVQDILKDAIFIKNNNGVTVTGLISPDNNDFYVSLNGNSLTNYEILDYQNYSENIKILNIKVNPKTVNFGITSNYGTDRYFNGITIKYTESIPVIAPWSNTIEGGDYYIELLKNNFLTVNTHILKAVLASSGKENSSNGNLDYTAGNYDYSFKVYDENGKDVTSFYNLVVYANGGDNNSVSVKLDKFSLTVEKSEIEIIIDEEDGKGYNVTTEYNTEPQYTLLINGKANHGYTLSDFLVSGMLINGTSDYASIYVKSGIDAMSPSANIYVLTLPAFKNSVSASFYTEEDKITNNLISDFNNAEYTTRLVKKLVIVQFEDINITYGEIINDYKYRVDGVISTLDTLPGISDAELTRLAFSLPVGTRIIPGTYDINFATELYMTNYNIQLVAGTLTVDKWKIYVTVNDTTVNYGTQPQFAASYSNLPDFNSLILMEIRQGAKMSIDGTEIGEYPIKWEMTDENLNALYEFIIEKQGMCTITPATIVVKIYGNSKLQGSLDPTLYYEIVSGQEFLDELEITGELVREQGESAGTYLISAENLSAGKNFVIVVDNSEGESYLTIMPDTRNIALIVVASILGILGIISLVYISFLLKKRRNILK